jgi:carbamoyl-phosphate synthase large subunit
METKKILVTGIGGNVGQGILRNIRDLYPNLYIIGVDISNFTSGNYLCNKTYKIPYSYDKNYIPTIMEIVEKEKVDLIIPSTDYEIYYLSLNQEKINATIVSSDANTSKIYLDKYNTYLHHKKHNIPFANSWLPEEFSGQEENIIAKPREGRGSRGIIINPENPKELSSEYVIQSLLIGKEITTAAYVTKENKLHGFFTMERELENGTTSKSKVIFDYNTEIEKILSKMLQYNKLRGSFNLQSIVLENNMIIPFEINCRISGTNSIRHNLGFQDVKYAIQEYLFNENPDQPKPIEGIATRILFDVIYPGATKQEELNNKNSMLLNILT